MGGCASKLLDAHGWADIAQRYGYYDQAHMISDFRRFTGHSPTRYAALKLPDCGGVLGD